MWNTRPLVTRLLPFLGVGIFNNVKERGIRREAKDGAGAGGGRQEPRPLTSRLALRAHQLVSDDELRAFPLTGARLFVMSDHLLNVVDPRVFVESIFGTSALGSL